MKTQSIKWNGRVQDISHLGQKTGDMFIFEEAQLSSPEYINPAIKYIYEIEEIDKTIYNIKYKLQYKEYIQRVFNPIEVIYVEERKI
jgi:hypothetical protein